MERNIPFYPYSHREAERENELPLWSESHRGNVDCARAIERAIRESVRGDGIRDDCARAVLEQYGYKRTAYVLANSMRELDTADRLSEEARRWCAETYVPPDKSHNRYFAVDTAAPLLDAFILQTRTAIQALGLFGPEHCKADSGELDYTGRVLVLGPRILREECWTPKDQLWYAHSGNGCNPHGLGRSILCTCLGDGETARWNRADFTGVLDEQYLPDWAVEKLAELRGHQQSEQAPSMGGLDMT